MGLVLLSHLDSLLILGIFVWTSPLNTCLDLTANDLEFAISHSVLPYGLEEGLVSTTPSEEQQGCQLPCPPLPFSHILPAKPESSWEQWRSGETLLPGGLCCGLADPGHSTAHLGAMATARLLSLQCSEQRPRRGRHARVGGTASTHPGGGLQHSLHHCLLAARAAGAQLSCSDLENRLNSKRWASLQTTQAAIWKWRIFFLIRPFSRREKIPLLGQAHPQPGVWLRCTQHDNKHLAESLFPSGPFLWFPHPDWHFLPLLLYKEFL